MLKFQKTVHSIDKEGEINIDCAYQLFDLSRDASDQDIRKAHHRLALRWHPDIHPEKRKAEHIMQRINSALDAIERHLGSREFEL